jgi:hypothetical protein
MLLKDYLKEYGFAKNATKSLHQTPIIWTKRYLNNENIKIKKWHNINVSIVGKLFHIKCWKRDLSVPRVEARYFSNQESR